MGMLAQFFVKNWKFYLFAIALAILYIYSSRTITPAMVKYILPKGVGVNYNLDIDEAPGPIGDLDFEFSLLFLNILWFSIIFYPFVLRGLIRKSIFILIFIFTQLISFII